MKKPDTREDEIYAKVRLFIADEMLLYTHIPSWYLDRAAMRIVTFLKVEERETLSYDAACRLSRVFNEGASLELPQDYQINEWLKKLIVSARNGD